MKNASLWILLLCSGLMAAYLIFVGAVSIWVGIREPGQDAFWLPVLTGTVLVLAVSWVFLRLGRFLYARIKQTDRLRD